MNIVHDFGYPVIVGQAALGELANSIPVGISRICVISDQRVFELHGENLMSCLPGDVVTDVVTFPVGEASKTRQTKAMLEDRMLAKAMGRDTCVIGFGGGVTTDLAGFVAATYMRGIPWTAVPTTLLAAVDASLGGKTGVDTEHGKNLIGSFHPPVAVMTDTSLLKTLPEDELKNGLAEMIKHAVLADASYMERTTDALCSGLLSDHGRLALLIRDSVVIKARFVVGDLKDKGTRMLLNFGHTIGHGIEAASGYCVSHGTAVSIGMMVETAIAKSLSMMQGMDTSRLEQVLSKAGLPTRIPPGLAPKEILGAMKSDKKKVGSDGFMLSLPVRLGDFDANVSRPVTKVRENQVMSALEEFSN